MDASSPVPTALSSAYRAGYSLLQLLTRRMTQKMDMEWVIVRPVVLRDKPAKGRYTAGPSARVGPLVPLSFDDCADCLLRAATDEPNWIGKIVNVGS
jgi:hypothetical protein